jgi:hypothetical protein
MPTSMNGCGTMYCGRAAAVHWEEPHFTSPRKPDHDAVVCVTLLLLPLIPLRPCHVYDHTGTAAREIPLRWSGRLLARAMLRPLLVLAALAGGFVAACLAFAFVDVALRGLPWSPPHAMVGLALLAPAALAGLRWFAVRDRRDRDIRLLLGRYEYGSSDPALWHPDVLRQASVETLIGSSEPERTAEPALREGDYACAMLAARLVAARDPEHGEALTDRILRDHGARKRLDRLRKEPWRVAELRSTVRVSAAETTAPEPPGIPFYDKRRYSESALDAAGGPGFADYVRAHPRLERAAPSSIVIRALLLGMLVLFAAVAVSPPSPTDPKDTRSTRLLGGGLMIALFGWILQDTHTRRVIIGEGKLRVSNQTALLDAVEKVGRRTIFVFFTAVSIKTAGGQVEWPYRKGESEELERVLRAVIALRPAAPDGPPGSRIRSDHSSVHFAH